MYRDTERKRNKNIQIKEITIMNLIVKGKYGIYRETFRSRVKYRVIEKNIFKRE